MRQLGVFAKYWEPGQVKTRLAAGVGAQRAADLYRSFLETVLVRFGQPLSDPTAMEPARPDCHRVLAYAPPQRREDFERLAAGQWQLEPQADGDLGTRMRAYFENALRNGYDQVLLIGSDAPTLPAERIVEAFAALERAAVVLGPAGDGGYYLVGARERTPDIFDKIHWGSAEVWDQTLHRLRATATPFATLDPWYDVDDETGLKRLQLQLADCQDDAALQQLREKIWPTVS
jgi:rSAM/selenodomain-associated transferase 1